MAAFLLVCLPRPAMAVRTYIDVVPDTNHHPGFARLATAIVNVSDAATARGCTPVLLDAGDQILGTLWDKFYKGMTGVEVRVTNRDFNSIHRSSFIIHPTQHTQFQNMVGVQAMTIGNHEFDHGSAGLLNFSRAATFPILSANTDFSAVPDLAALVQPHTVLDVDGVQVGVVGVTTKNTATTAQLDAPIKFSDEATAAQQSIDALHAQGVPIVVVLSHIGYEEDMAMAQKLNGSQLIIGGHSHTFLFSNTSDNPLPALSVCCCIIEYALHTNIQVDASGKTATDTPAGAYPTVVPNANDDPALIVQAYWASRCGICVHAATP